MTVLPVPPFGEKTVMIRPSPRLLPSRGGLRGPPCGSRRRRSRSAAEAAGRRRRRRRAPPRAAPRTRRRRAGRSAPACTRGSPPARRPAAPTSGWRGGRPGGGRPGAGPPPSRTLSPRPTSSISPWRSSASVSSSRPFATARDEDAGLLATRCLCLDGHYWPPPSRRALAGRRPSREHRVDVLDRLRAVGRIGDRPELERPLALLRRSQSSFCA